MKPRKRKELYALVATRRVTIKSKCANMKERIKVKDKERVKEKLKHKATKRKTKYFWCNKIKTSRLNVQISKKGKKKKKGEIKKRKETSRLVPHKTNGGR